MQLVATAEERALAGSLRELFAEHCPTDLVRSLREPAAERLPAGLWEVLTRAEVFALPFAEDVGGAGGGLDDLAVAYAEAGRALCPTLVQSTLHLGLAVDALGDEEQRKRVLPLVTGGQLRGSAALASPYDAADVRPRLRATPLEGGVEVSGRVDFVADAELAELVLVTASLESYGEPARLVALLLDPAADGVTLETLPSSDGDCGQSLTIDRLHLPTSSVLAGPGGRGLAVDQVRRVAMTVRALQCVDMVGGAEAVIERTVDHVCGREQFGRPIGSFQAAQHLVADMDVATRAARLAARSAVFWLGRGRPGVRETAIAVMHAATAYRRVTLDAHQLHGGMGYVVETDLHLWSERARRLGVEGGGADVAAAWLEEEIGLG